MDNESLYQVRILKFLSWVFGGTYALRAVFAFAQSAPEVGLQFILSLFLLPLVSLFVVRQETFRVLNFLWVLVCMLLEFRLALIGYTNYVQFYFLIPLFIILASLLAELMLGAIITVIATVLGLYLVLTPGDPARIFLWDVPAPMIPLEYFTYLIGVQSLIVFVILLFEEYLDKCEQEIARRRSLRDQTLRRAAFTEVFGNLAHEVNNPLAIIEASLQSLKRGAAKGEGAERKLYQFIGDAKDRLKDVTRKLQEFSEIQLAESFRTRKDEAARPHELIGKLASLGSFSPRASDEAANIWWITEFSIRLANYFYKNETANPTEQLRTRLTIIQFFVCISLVLATLIPLVVMGSMALNQLMIYASGLGLMVFCLVIIKLTGKVEWVGLFYLCAISGVISFTTVFAAKSIYATALHLIPIILVLGLFICPGKKERLILIGWFFLCDFFCFFYMRDFGTVLPFGLRPELIVEQIALTQIAKSVLVIMSTVAYVEVRRRSILALSREAVWLSNNAKVEEVTHSIKSLFPQFEGPLAVFERDLEALAKDSGQRADALLELEARLASMIQITRSLGWIYRAFRDENVGRTAGVVLEKQVELLLQAKVRQKDWALAFQPSGEDYFAHGPLPSLALLLLTLVEQVMSLQPERRALEVRVSLLDGGLIWSLDWGTESIDRDLMETDFVRELLILARGSLKLSRNGDRLALQVFGRWLVEV